MLTKMETGVVWGCIAVTRGGWGDVWGFKDPAAADAHPLIQGCDPRLVSCSDVTENWNYLYIARFCGEVIKDQSLVASVREIMEKTSSPGDRDRGLERVAEWVWDRLQSMAQTPPTDSSAICALVTEDRRLHEVWYDHEQRRRSSVTEATTTAAPAQAAPKTKTIAGYPETHKISFGKNKEDKTYDTKDNNPKRGASAVRFALYKSGMTLAQAAAVGITAADIKWDVSKGFISVSA